MFAGELSSTPAERISVALFLGLLCRCPSRARAGLFYNPAPPFLFGAAGIDVDVAWLDGGSITATGNSFAAPVVAGYVARVLGEQPGLTPFQVTTILQATADNVRTATAETWGRG